MRLRHVPTLHRHLARLSAVALALLGPLAHAAGKLVDGFGVDQMHGSGVVIGADILTGSRELLALAPPAADAVRVDDGRLWIDTQTTRVLVRYATATPGPLHNFALSDSDDHGDWLLTYRATQAAMLTLVWTTEPAPGVRLHDMFTGVLTPSPELITLNLGPLVDPQFPLFRTRSFSLQLDFTPGAGSFELDALAIAAPVPEPATTALWMAGLAAMAGLGRRALRAQPHEPRGERR